MARFDTIAVYMMTDRRYGTLSTGVASDLVHRVSQHRSGFWRGLGIHAQVQLHAACLVRGACGHGCCDPARDVDQTIFACVEDQSDRGGEPRLAGPVGQHPAGAAPHNRGGPAGDSGPRANRVASYRNTTIPGRVIFVVKNPCLPRRLAQFCMHAAFRAHRQAGRREPHAETA